VELRHLRYFVAVAEELHFGRAAARLHIAQPPLSRQIRDLEQEVGAELFVRGTRGVELTAAGRAFLGEVRQVLAQAERALRAAQRASRGETGRLRVGFVEAATYSGTLARVLGVFRQDVPDVSLGLFELDSLEQAEALREGRIDVGIVHSPPPDAHRWLRVERVFEDRLVAALPRAHPLAARPHLALGDFAAEPFVFFPRFTGPTLYDHLIAACRSAGFSPRVVQEAAGWSTLAALVAAGVGVSFAPRSVAQVERPGRGLPAGARAVGRHGDVGGVEAGRGVAGARALPRGAAGRGARRPGAARGRPAAGRPRGRRVRRNPRLASHARPGAARRRGRPAAGPRRAGPGAGHAVVSRPPAGAGASAARPGAAARPSDPASAATAALATATAASPPRSVTACARRPMSGGPARKPV
jgi:DNA-binding transcriptional LysR family regulator